MYINDLAITSLDAITAFDIATGAFMFKLDELQSASIQNSEEKVDITGKQGRKITSLKRNKAVTVTGANGLVSGGLLEGQTGGTFANGATNVSWTDYLTVQSNGATTSYKAIGTTGAEITALYVKNADGTISQILTQAQTASSGKFAYAPATKALTFSGITDGTEIVVIYERKITADVLENKSDVYSKKCKMYIDATAEDKCSNVFHVQFYIPKADFSGNFNTDLGDNQAIHNFEAEALAGACGAGGSLWSLTVFGANAPDVA